MEDWGLKGVVGTAIKVTSGIAIGVVNGAVIKTTNSTAVRIASKINKAAGGISGGFCGHC